MIYFGRVKREAIKDDGFLNFAQISKEEKGQIYFEANEEFVSAIANEMSEELRPGCYSLIRSDTEIYVIFPEKIFYFSPDEGRIKADVLKYGASLGIGEEELAL